MGEVMNGCTFPGRIISWAGEVWAGDTTDTAVMATCEVSVRNLALALRRDRMPDIKMAAVTSSAIDSASQRLYDWFAARASFNSGTSGDCPPVCFTASD